MVVYAGRSFSGNVSWISRIEALPRFHSASMISSSNLVSLGLGIRSPINVCDITTCVVDVKIKICEFFRGGQNPHERVVAGTLTGSKCAVKWRRKGAS